MKILLVHNRYQVRGGEDTVFEAERDLLASAGHEIYSLEVTNDSVSTIKDRVLAGIGTVYSSNGRRLVGSAVRTNSPDIVHVHNFFPLLSPSIFDACSSLGVPTVMTLHNYRLLCVNGLLLREGKPCEECIGTLPLKSLYHRCYRGSVGASAAVATMISAHSLMRTWHKKVNRFIALTDFAQELFVRGGLPSESIVVKPNCAARPLALPKDVGSRTGFLYVGRLSAEKGLDTLLRAWTGKDFPLTIIGDGPMVSEVEVAAKANSAIRFLGPRPRDFVLREIAQASAVIVPSVWYENFPMTIVESFAHGTPVIASNIGALPHIVQDGKNGLLFSTSDHRDLASIVTTHSDMSSEQKLLLSRSAYQVYQDNLSPEACLASLEAIYQSVLTERADGVVDA